MSALGEYIRLQPLERLKGKLRVPGDKSISHRALFLAARARGQSEISNLNPGVDVARTRRLLERLHVQVLRRGIGADSVGGGVAVARPPSFRTPRKPLECGNSGTTARLALGILATETLRACLTGDRSLRRRPMDRVIEPLQKMGASFQYHGSQGKLPLSIQGGTLQGIRYAMPVGSAQVKTAILLAGLQAEGETLVEEKAPSRDHTERLLKAMGAKVTISNGIGADSVGFGTDSVGFGTDSVGFGTGSVGSIRLRPSRLEPLRLRVPGDFSSAAYLLALACLRPGSDLVLENVGLNPSRTALLTLLHEMGAKIDVEDASYGIEPEGSLRILTPREGFGLKAVRVDRRKVAGLIDELPLLAVLATQIHGETTVRDAAELRVKESDRISAIVRELGKMGAHVEELADGFATFGPQRLHGAKLDAHGDHRMAMSLSVAAGLAGSPSLLRGSEWVNISYPGFFTDMQSVAG